MKQIIVVLAAFMVLVSCKKENGSVKPFTTPLKLKAITYEGSPGYFKFEYDNTGRVTKVLGDWGNATYEYSNAGFVYKEFYYNQPTPRYTLTAVLNADGTIKSGTYTEVSGNNTVNGTLAYTYDGNGQLVKRVDESVADGKFEWVYTWTNGNVTKIEEYKNGSLTNTSYDDYYVDKLNVSTLDSWFMRTYYNTGLTGKTSKNLIKEELSKNQVNVINHYFDFSYDLEAGGNVLKLMSKDMITNTTYVTNFQYE
jgi:hypothetical protein